MSTRYYRNYPPGYDESELGLEDTAFALVDVHGKGFDADADLGDAREFYSRALIANRAIVRDHIGLAKVAARAAGPPIVHLSLGLTEGSEWRQLSQRTVVETPAGRE